jgi:hypothetical protein
MTELIEPDVVCYYCGQVVCLDASYNHINCEEMYEFCLQMKIEKLEQELTSYIQLKKNKQLTQ